MFRVTLPMETPPLRSPVGDTPALAEETTLLTWRIHPLRDAPAHVLPCIGAGYVTALLLWWVLLPAPAALLLPLVALTLGLSDFLFPTTYRLTTRGIYVHCAASRLFLAWSDVRRARYGADGLFLSPLVRPSRLDDFRGIRLRFADGNETQVLEVARRAWRRDSGNEKEAVVA